MAVVDGPEELFWRTTMKQYTPASVRSTHNEEPGNRDGRPKGLGAAPTLDRVAPLRLLRFPAIRERTGLSRSTIWRLERRGAFPRHRRISANAVAWIEDEINDWIRERRGE